MGMIQEFKDFAIKGNVFDMAIGVIMGGAFGKIVGSLIEDVLMPIIGSIAGKVDFSQYKFAIKQAVVDSTGKVTEPEIAVKFGSFVTVLVNFLILAFVVFLMVKAFNTAKKKFEKEQPAAAPAGPTPDQKLLTEIRDLLSKR